MAERLATMRVDYDCEGFDIDALAPTWHEQLARWLVEAEADGFLGAQAQSGQEQQ